MPTKKKRPERPSERAMRLSKGAYEASKRGPGDVHGVTRGPIRDDDPGWAKLDRWLAEITAALQQIAMAMNRPPPAGVPGRIGPSQLPGGDQEYISGQWHRRAGDVYARVAEPGTPNAGSVGETFGTAHDDDDLGDAGSK